MDKNPESIWASLSRREFLSQATALAAATSLPASVFAQQAGSSTGSDRTVLPTNFNSKPNIVFVFTDQERYFDKLPGGLSLPAHERLTETGVTFHNHYCPAVMCTSSRSVLLTGLTTVDNGMFENCDVRYVPNLSTDIPTIGHMLREAGYYTAYKGKWHLSKEFEIEEMDILINEEMEKYGFSDYYSPGDVIAHTLGGYEFDHLISGSAITWLRRNGRRLADEGQPWALFVSLINPHDIMYFNTDLPGEQIQDTGRLTMRAAPAPKNALYDATWDMPVPQNLRQAFDEPGRPGAHGEFDKMWGYVLGRVPMEEERWQRFNNFYINSIRSVDMQVKSILDEMDALNLTDSTAFVYTSDHGELAGSHGLRGKGPFAYQEGIHLPLYMTHPDVRGGQNANSLTGHIDIVPTLLAIAGVEAGRVGDIAGRELPGKDFSSVLGNPGQSDLHSTRESILFTYSGMVTNDGELFRVVSEAKAADRNPMLSMLRQGWKPDLKKRGSLRTAFDGRYKFTRYFSPLDHNTPTTIDELYRWNDVELFDLESDPTEMVNLAMDPDANRELIVSMNAKLNAVIKTEIGADDGRELPNIPLVDWEIDLERTS